MSTAPKDWAPATPGIAPRVGRRRGPGEPPPALRASRRSAKESASASDGAHEHSDRRQKPRSPTSRAPADDCCAPAKTYCSRVCAWGCPCASTKKSYRPQ